MRPKTAMERVERDGIFVCEVEIEGWGEGWRGGLCGGVLVMWKDDLLGVVVPWRCSILWMLAIFGCADGKR